MVPLLQALNLRAAEIGLEMQTLEELEKVKLGEEQYLSLHTRIYWVLRPALPFAGQGYSPFCSHTIVNMLLSRLYDGKKHGARR